MKAFQRILAVLLCLVMSLGMISMVASAATTDPTIDTTQKGSLTIHKYEYNGNSGVEGTGASTDPVPEGAILLDGVKFKITKVAELDTYYGIDGAALPTVEQAKTMPAIGESKEDVTVDGVVTFSNLDLGLYLVQEIEAPAQITQPVPDFLVSIPMTNADGDGWLYNVHVFPKNASTYATVTLKKMGQVGEAAATVLESAIFKLEKKGDNDTWTEVTENNKGTAIDELKTNAQGLITVSDLAPGTYRFTETSAPNGYIMDGTLHYEFTIADDGKVTANGSEVTSANPIVVTNYKPDAEKEIVNQNDASIGEKVSYKVTITVPQNISKLSKFSVTDAPNGLKVDLDTITVKCDGTAVATTAYTAPTTNNADGGFTINFVPAQMTAYAGKDIVIEYQAEITAAAITNNKATNDVTLTYNDVIGSDSDKTIDPPGTETNLFDFTITKYKDSVAEGNKLDDVKFVLYKDSVADANKVSVVDLGDGNYRVADSDDATTVTEMTTANGGNLKVSGLGNGTYKLVETKTAAGYNLLKDPITITVNGADVPNQNVINKEGFTLPQTGGIGTLMFIIIGGVLMAGGICLIVPNKKRAI